jgi:hypothetical protein
MSGFALRQHLASLMDQKSSQLQVLGSMGQEILKQQQELEERIKDFEEEGEDDVGDEARSRLRDLDNAMKTWEDQNEGMLRELGAKVSTLMIGQSAELISSRRPRRRQSQSQCPNPKRHRARCRGDNEMLSIEPWTWNLPRRSGKTCLSRSGDSKPC